MIPLSMIIGTHKTLAEVSLSLIVCMIFSGIPTHSSVDTLSVVIACVDPVAKHLSNAVDSFARHRNGENGEWATHVALC